MANINKWKIFNKAGSLVSMYADAYIDLRITDPTNTDASYGREAEGFFITNSDGKIAATEMINSGHSYDPLVFTPQIYYTDMIEGVEHVIPADSSILYKDVVIFNPNQHITKGISDIKVDISTLYNYPSVVYNGNIYMNPVSQGLVETEHLFILEEASIGYVRPYDASNYNLVLQMVGDEDQIQFFTVDETSQTVTWSDIILVEMETSIPSVVPYYNANENVLLNTNISPISVNIGFKSDEEGVYKRTMRVYHVIDGNYYTVAEIVVNAQSIGEDERFRTLLANFGLPDPKDFPKLFKEADINEDLPDYNIVNPKSKHMILEHSNIMPYIGTYKALINAIKWLGYDDVYIREWFKNIKTEEKLSFIVPYDAKDRAQTMLIFSQEQRKEMKKLNQLSLIYCITRETDQIDDYGVPITEDCYSYNLNEVLIKLFALKDWLEKNIIGVNAKIIDITGEGVYFERFKSNIYSTTSYGFTDNYRELMTPYSF